MRTRLTLLLALTAACNVAANGSSDEEASTSESSSESGDEGQVPYPDPKACSSSADCDAGVCAAPYDPGGTPPQGEAVCVPGCVDADDGHRVCVDDESCCGDLECDDVGLCGEAATEETGDETEGGSETGADETDSGTETG